MNGSRIIIDLDRNEEIPVFNGLNGLTSFVFKQGDSVSLDLIFVASTGGSGSSLTDVPVEDAVPIVAVGDLEGLPTAGSFRLAYQSQVTGDLDFDSTPAEVQAALNLLSTIVSAGGVTVSKLGTGYLFEFNSNGARDPIVADSTGLVPESGAAIVEAVPGDATTRSRQVLRFVVTPFAYQGTFTALPAPSASLESLIEWNGTESVTRLVLDNTKTGTIQITFKKTNEQTYAIAVSADTDEAGLQTAISSLDGLTDKVSVYSSGFRTFDISIQHEGFTGTGFVNGLAVDASGCIGYNGFRGTLSFNTVEAEVFLAGETSKQATIEVVLSGDNQRTVLSADATILADLIETSPTTTLELDTPLGKIEAAALYLSKAGNLAGLASVATARSNLGLGSMALETASDYLTKAGNLSGLASVPTARTNLGLGTMALETAANYLLKNNPAITGTAQVTGSAPGTIQTFDFGSTFINLTSVDSSTGGSGIGGWYSALLTDNSALGDNDPSVEGWGTSMSFFKTSVTDDGSGNPVSTMRNLNLKAEAINFDAGTANKISLKNNLSGSLVCSHKLTGTSVGGLAGVNIGIGGTSTNATTPGDLWIPAGGVSLNFRDATGSWRQCLTTSSAGIIDISSSSAALRVTQRGIGEAFRVEDSTTPDATPFVIDANGKVGIGIAADATAALRLDANGIKFGSNAVVQAVSAVVTDSGTYDKEIPVTINGVNYRIPCRQV